MPARLLPIYLSDHLLGATVGVELCRRTQRENAGTELGEFLFELLGELEADRASLVSVLERLGLRPSPLKVALGWSAEKLGRLKPNGQLEGYSPLSRLLELEGLAGGIDGKLGLWLSLAEIRGRDGRLAEVDFEALAERARSQRARLEPYRLAAAREAL